MHVSEMWIPITMFAGLALVLSLWLWFRYKAKNAVQATIRTAIEKGSGLSPELIENLVNPPVAPFRDLRRGVISIAVAAGIAAFGLVLGEDDAVRPLLGIAALPFTIGLAFLLMHRFGRSG